MTGYFPIYTDNFGDIYTTGIAVPKLWPLPRGSNPAVWPLSRDRIQWCGPSCLRDRILQCGPPRLIKDQDRIFHCSPSWGITVVPPEGSWATPQDRLNTYSSGACSLPVKNLSMVEQYHPKTVTFMLVICSTLKKKADPPRGATPWDRLRIQI
jgi:hypothetical protein